MSQRSFARVAIAATVVSSSLILTPGMAMAGKSVMCSDWEPYGPRPACDSTEICQPGFFERLKQCWFRKRVRCKKQPFLHHLYGDCDLRAHPVCPPLCHPTWGYHETHWRRFPGCESTYPQFGPPTAPLPAEAAPVGP